MSERDEFEAPFAIDHSHPNQAWVTLGFSSEEACKQFIKAIRNGRSARATPQQAVLALTEPVAWHIGNADGSINKIGAVYIRRSLAEKHIASYEGELDAQIVPLYAAPQPFPEPKEPEHAHDWRFSLQEHVYKCDCGATRGDFPFGPATFKD